MKRTPIVLLFVPLLAACAGWSTTSLAVWGPYPDTSEQELVQQVVHAVEARGYTVSRVDAANGFVEVYSNAGRVCSVPSSFRFRFYRGGWIELQVRGCDVHRRPDGRHTMPARVHREYVGLADRLMEPAR